MRQIQFPVRTRLSAIADPPYNADKITESRCKSVVVFELQPLPGSRCGFLADECVALLSTPLVSWETLLRCATAGIRWGNRFATHRVQPAMY